VAEAPTDPFASEILTPEEIPVAEAVIEAPIEAPLEPESDPADVMSDVAPTPPDIPVSSEPAGEHPQVDRIAAVRELAGLFKESGEDAPFQPPPAAPVEDVAEPEQQAEEPIPAAEEAQPVEEPVAEEQIPEPVTVPDNGSDDADGRKRVEDDDQVTRSLISRLIDGVKGL
jgi:hypothetical protein